jgi:hypothetical protein
LVNGFVEGDGDVPSGQGSRLAHVNGGRLGRSTEFFDADLFPRFDGRGRAFARGRAGDDTFRDPLVPLRRAGLR